MIWPSQLSSNMYDNPGTAMQLDLYTRQLAIRCKLRCKHQL